MAHLSSSFPVKVGWRGECKLVNTYEEAVNWIHSRLRFGIKPGLKRMEWMMERLNHPERRLKTIHVAGTNGKGSTVTYVRNILQKAEYKVGTFTSPYIEQFNERISVNGQPIGNQELVDVVNIIKPLAEQLEETDLGSPTEFEIITAMSLYYFAHINIVDVVVYEVGLGGRLDSTNIIHPLVSVITNIGFDHMAILGETVEEIASEKAGIIKPGVPVITTASQENALDVIRQKAKENKAKLYEFNKQFTVMEYNQLEKGEQFTIQTPFITIENIELSMKGKHQVNNAALAIMTATYLKTFYSFLIEEHHIKAGLKEAFWPGRMEEVVKTPSIYLDGAHNEEGIATLVDTIKTRFSKKRVHILFSALSDKPLNKMIAELESVAHSIYYTTFDYPRALPARQLAELSSHKNHSYDESWENALNNIKASLSDEDVLIVTGSLYFISTIRSFLKQ